MRSVDRENWRRRFSEWFREVLDEAEIYDYRYPIKGCGVWRPYGFALRRNVLQIVRNILNSTNHEEILLPLLIPENFLAKEAEHVRGFEDQVYWVTMGGRDKLDLKLALRPTSETAIGPMLKLWIKSHRDLPKKYYQIVSVFRYETKATKPLIRVREITTFKEAHTAHTTLEEADKQVREAIGAYAKIFDELGIPYVINKRPEWDKFAGALYTIAFDTLMPDGRAMQIGTVHNLGQNFSRAFEIKYLTKDGRQEYVWQTCYGISERVLAALISIHGDDRGTVLSPNVAPIQTIIIPIPYKGEEEKILEKCIEIENILKKNGIRVKLDNREDITPGSKFYDWERRGVPTRIEIGPKDLREGKVTISRRDTLERIECREVEVVDKLRELFKLIHESMKRKAWSWFKENTYRISNIAEGRRILEEKGGIIEVYWCGSEKCGHKIQDETESRMLGEALDLEDIDIGECIICGRKTSRLARLAKTY
ncbi:MAG: proline--tRNA ligase [archaeon GB-1845-036]|nr:proline--tRNA ligase [Candidatus Culexmicrobium thermophilum]